MRELIKVTKEDIKHGTKSFHGLCGWCAITSAVERKLFNSDISVYVDSSLAVYIDGTREDYKLSREACRFVRRMYAGKSVKPFNFYMTLVK